MGAACTCAQKKRHSAKLPTKLTEPRTNHENSIDKTTMWNKELLHHQNSISVFKRNKPELFEEFLIKGPPDAYRWEVWKMALSYCTSQNNYELLNVECSDEDDLAIRKDLDRTFPELGYFSRGAIGQRALYNVLTAFTSSHPEIGYCQGMNYITGVLLLASQGNEGETYGMLECMFERLDLKRCYEANFPLVKELCTMFHEALETHYKSVARHLQEQDMNDHFWLVKWYLTLFSYSLSFHTVLRIWDAIFAKGIYYLVNVTLAIVSIFKKEILSKQLGEILQSLPSLNEVPFDDDYLIESSLKFEFYFDISLEDTDKSSSEFSNQSS